MRNISGVFLELLIVSSGMEERRRTPLPPSLSGNVTNFRPIFSNWPPYLSTHSSTINQRYHFENSLQTNVPLLQTPVHLPVSTSSIHRLLGVCSLCYLGLLITRFFSRNLKRWRREWAAFHDTPFHHFFFLFLLNPRALCGLEGEEIPLPLLAIVLKRRADSSS